MQNKNLIIDSHAHLNFKAFEEDLDEVIERTLKGGVWAINVGSQYETGKMAVEIAERYEEGMYASVGMHPLHTIKDFVKGNDKQEREESGAEKFDYDKYKELALNKKVVAIGETGLDYYYKPKNRTKLAEFKQRQKEVFIGHLKLAKELDLPLILHCRMAHNEILDILKVETRTNRLRGVIHCFTGNWEEARRYLEMGLYIGFTGIIYKMDLKETIRNVPINKILLETDCPYLTPPGRGERNEPLFVKDITEEIAKVKNIGADILARTVTENSKELFKI